MSSCADGKWSLRELLRAPLPDPLDMSGSSRSVLDHDGHRDTHPEKVIEWPGWEAWVKDMIQRGTSVSPPLTSTGYLSLQYEMGFRRISCL